MTFARVLIAFVLAVLTATTGTAMLFAFPFSLIPPFALLALFFSSSGFIPAALLLGPAFVVAGLLSPYRLTLMIAGGIAGSLFVLIALVMSQVSPSPVPHGYFSYPFVMLGRHPSLLGLMMLAVPATVAGLCAGWVFGRISTPAAPFYGPSDRRTYSLLVLPALSLAVLFVVWKSIYPPILDRLCAHGMVVRVKVGNTDYEIPAAYQPDIRFAKDTPENEARVFDRYKWRGTPAARQAHFQRTYCQTADDAPWQISSFSVFSMYAKFLPYQVINLGVSEGKFKPQKYFFTKFISESPPRGDKDLWFLAPETRIWRGPYANSLDADLADGSHLSIFWAHGGFSEIDALHAAGPMLRALRKKPK